MGSLPTTDRLDELLDKLETCNRWLTYWSLWPLLTLLQQIVIMNNSSAKYYAVPEFQVLIVLSVWCAWWGGSYLSILFARLIERLSYVLRQRGMDVAGTVADGAKEATVRGWEILTPRGLTNAGLRLGDLEKNKYAALATLALFAVVLSYLFFRVFEIVSYLFTVIMWWYVAWETCILANETASTLSELRNETPIVSTQNNGRRIVAMVEIQLRPKLCFWIVNGLWTGFVVNLPVLGLLAGVWTPVVLIVALVAGQGIGRVILLAAADLVRKPAQIWNSFRSRSKDALSDQGESGSNVAPLLSTPRSQSAAPLSTAGASTPRSTPRLQQGQQGAVAA